MSQPDLIVVLVEPEQGVNVGFIARTMACFGVAALRVVGEKHFHGDPGALKTAKGADHIIAGIEYFRSLPEAIGDCQYSFGFTRRIREPAQRIQNVRTAVGEWQKSIHANSKTALVFGRESQGLSREECLVLSHLVRIDSPSETLSLNVSHAVAIALYAFADPGSELALLPENEGSLSTGISNSRPVHSEQWQFLRNLIEALEQKGFFKGGKASAQKDYVQLLWQRLHPNQMELDFLSGMLKRLMTNS